MQIGIIRTVFIGLKRMNGKYFSQVNENLPWMQQIIQIACKIGVDLEEGRTLCKIKWKKRVDEKIYQYHGSFKAEFKHISGYL